MRSDWTGLPATNARRDVRLLYYPTLSPGEHAVGRRIAFGYLESRPYAAGDLVSLDGTAYRATADSRGEDPSSSPSWTPAVAADYALPDPVDLTPYVISLSHGARELRFSLAWHMQITELPRVGSVLAAVDAETGGAYFAGQLEVVDERTEQRGRRTLSATARSREATPWWRRLRWSSNVYPVGTEISVIMRDVLAALGVTDEEIDVGPQGRWTPHTTMQLADLTAWDMLDTLCLPLVVDPFVDARGRIKLISRDVTRPADIELSKADVVSISGSKASPPLTAVVLKWLDPQLAKSSQQAQVLATESLTAGFFKAKQERRVFWSKDRAQRAENTHMKIVASVNDALLPVGSESYHPLDEFSGRITVETGFWVPGLATVAIAGLLFEALYPDDVILTSEYTGITISVGRVLEMVSMTQMLLVMMSLGTGQYEIWGEPYDYIHAVNTTEAYNDSAREWERVEETIESDYIGDEAHARQVATLELLYRSLSARTQTVEIRDDPRIEPGDILALPNGERFYVTEYARDLTRGAAHTLRLSGFQV